MKSAAASAAFLWGVNTPHCANGLLQPDKTAVNFAVRQLPNGNGRIAPSLPRLGAEFPATMPLGEFLFEYLYRCGVRYSFGIPGDFVLPTYAWLERSKIKGVTMTHEPSAGFAADAYARI